MKQNPHANWCYKSKLADCAKLPQGHRVLGTINSSLTYFHNLPETVVVLVAETTVLLEFPVGAKGTEGPKGTVGPRGILGPSGRALLTAVLVKVDVPETLVKVGVTRLRSLDVNGSWIREKIKS